MKNILIILIVVVFAGNAWSQVAKGDKQVQTTTSIMATTGEFGTTMGNIFLKSSQYMTDNIELGASIGLSLQTEFEFDPITFETSKTLGTSMAVGIFGAYSFLTEGSQLLPYVGAQLYSPDVSAESSILSVGVNGGIKYFLTEMVNVDAGLNIGTTVGENSGSGAVILFQVGLGVLFPSDF